MAIGPLGESMIPATVRTAETLPVFWATFVPGGKSFVTDNGNVILDCAVGDIPDPAKLEAEIHTVPGVVGTGLFVQITSLVLVADDDVEVIGRVILSNLGDDPADGQVGIGALDRAVAVDVQGPVGAGGDGTAGEEVAKARHAECAVIVGSVVRLHLRF